VTKVRNCSGIETILGDYSGEIMNFSKMFFTLTLTAFVATAAAAESKTAKCDDKANIYKTCSDQKAPFAAAVAKAKKENKIMVITFGADWCPWCRSLHSVMTGKEFQDALASEKAKDKTLASQLMFANVGVSHKIGDTRESVPNGHEIFAQIATDTKSGEQKINGMPYLVFYNPASGKAVFRDSGNLEKAGDGVGHDPGKIVAAIKEAVGKL
jgi:thiol-disulfide isomerase/thioredoxin